MLGFLAALLPFAIAEAAGPPARPVAAGEIVADAGATPALGMGLSGVVDWSTEQPFIDVMKTARPWVGHLPGQWGGWEHADLARAGALDADGWPRFIPPELGGISTLFLTGQPEAATGLAGRYRLTYEGEGEIALEGRVTRVTRRPGEIRFDYAPGEGFVLLGIRSSDPRGTGAYLRNIRVVAERDIDLFEAGAVFNPRWIARIRGIRAARFMDWMDTNDSEQVDWADRPRPGDYTYARVGVPVEVMVALANQLAVDPWFTMPHRATDAYARAFAEYVRDHLDPRRKTYVEWSNEVWNWQFGQTDWALEQARARWGADAPGDAFMQYAGLRAAEVARIWTEVFGPRADRLTRVVATQTGWLGLEAPLLEAPLYVAEDPGRNRPPAEAFDAYAVTGYFGNLLGGAKAPLVRGWLAEGDAEAKAVRELRDGALSGEPGDSLEALVGRYWPYQAEVARRHGLELVMYEGGTHVVGTGPAADDTALTDFLIGLNYSEAMGRLYDELLDGWRAAGGTLFNAFVDVAGPSKWGSWGALRHLDDATPRWDALMEFNASHPAWWDDRPASDFVAGRLLRGDGRIAGGPGDDLLLGGAGDDTLAAGGGEDSLHGGGGADTALLPGAPDEYRFRADGPAMIAERAGTRDRIRLFAIEQVAFTDGGETRRADFILR
ncbi:MAG: hypothetical protein DI556_04850 [Rhodovulum sulfidophilum]|uniref:Calcium-binding protein n=1 Tax=Rhodovulum sulfidophilum TaxID=35806 RepID=A0A2W5ND76_RHOSU|nr:MAG: hypothetical protein DI556_04850 [Rhodovulum sulfidophilum]